MKKLSILLCVIMVFSCFGATMSASAATLSNDEQIVAMPDLGIDIKEVSAETAEAIEDLLSQMNDIAVETNTISEISKIKTAAVNAKINNLNTEYSLLEERAKELGCIFLTDEQAIKYVYGESLPSNTTRASISYPSISGIKFAISYYTYNGNKMAKCIATQDPGKTSKLVKNYDTVEMYDNTKFSDLAKKGIRMTATRLGNYLLGSIVGGKVNFVVSKLAQLPGTVFPSTSSSSKAKLSLTVSTNSTVVHIWRYMNSDYYLRTASVKAKVNETWVLRDVNGKHYTKTHSYNSFSNYYDDNAQAIAVTSNQSYGIYQQYKTQGLLGIYFQKLEVSPFTAALPIHFAS